MTDRAIRVCLVLLLLGVASCAVLPQTFDERLVVAYETNIAVRDTATAALNAERISTDEARAVLRITDHARALIEVAEATRDEDALTMALEVLRVMEAELE